MEIFDYLRDHPWSAWMSLALVLGAAEMLTLDFTLLMLAGGAAAGGVTALIFPGMVMLQIIVALVSAVLLLFVLRPTLLAKVRNAPSYRGSFETLVGSEGVATAEITQDGGEVKVDGLTWNAQLVMPGRVLVGQKVEVQEVDGTTLKVYPSMRSAEGPGFPSLEPPGGR